MKFKMKFIALLFICLISTIESKAQDAYLGEIRMFAGNYAPVGWEFCNGQLMAINSNTALFSILGTNYGGDGRSTFALPDLRGRTPMSAGRHPGSDMNYVVGQYGGHENTTLSILNLPAHKHSISLAGLTGLVGIPVNTESGEEDEKNPGAGYLANNGQDRFSSSPSPVSYYGGQPLPVAIQGTATAGITGLGQSFNNRQPYVVVRYIICVSGIYPPRS
ncbi:phage tail protein [Tenacibaculum aiptasiae]|uniref:Phage tail protein n=1 Tax=Tenacibaculum aiptasiae TaxID=426481 RepID=A0A7J5ACC1_9FLAO|nr:tail fiber protein [Tenacibaculum aiptasiae]KAB1155221.1 phage tail protein [Tenacibaculum aiptasiae]